MKNLKKRNPKIVIGLFALVLSSLTLMSQVPEKFNYQAIIRDNTGALITNTKIALKIIITDGSNDVCVEEFTPVTNNFGLVTLSIGSSNPKDFAKIDWSKGSYAIKIELDQSGGKNYSSMGEATPLNSVPFALYAKNQFSGNYTDLTGTPDLTNFDQDVSDDFNGDYNNLINKPNTKDTIINVLDTTSIFVRAKKYKVGDKALGGTVFYVTPDGTHGLVAANKDQTINPGNTIQWAYASDLISNHDNHDNEGKKYTDWRLPNRYEAGLMHAQRKKIGGFIDDDVNIHRSYYWTSVSGSKYPENAYYISFEFYSSGEIRDCNKNTAPCNVRAIRSF